jgi:hypothetical protein
MSIVGVTSENADFTMDGTYQYYLVDCTSNNVTVTFGYIDDISGIGNQLVFIIKRLDTTSNTLTIVGTSGQTFDGNSSASLPTPYGNSVISLPTPYGSYSISYLSWDNNWVSVAT